MNRRSGLSLTEVLVTLFILGLGVISIMTMFPLGAMQMGQALKDDRTSQAAAQADGYMRAYWKKFVTAPNITPDPFTNAFDPGNNLPPVGTSYPVVVDPMGFVARGAGGGNVGGSSLSRQNLQLVSAQGGNQNTYAYRVCSLLDGFGYDQDGTPALNDSGNIDRESRYNWLWVLQRPINKNKNTANMTVVVFDKRAPMFAPASAEVGVSLASGAVLPGVTTGLTISSTNGASITKGTWVLDATIGTDDAGQSIRHALFYRVVSATPNGTGIDIEVQPPFRRADGLTTPFTINSLVVLAGVSEVFERPNPLTDTAP